MDKTIRKYGRIYGTVLRKSGIGSEAERVEAYERRLTVMYASDNYKRLYPKKYEKKIREWIKTRYGAKQMELIWDQTMEKYRTYLEEPPDYGGTKNGHAMSIYGSMLVFAMIDSLPDQPEMSELQAFTQDLFMEPFIKLGKLFDLNRGRDLTIIDRVFRKVAKRDNKDSIKWPCGFHTVYDGFDKTKGTTRYHFTQCPVAEFARKHDMLDKLPLMCNCDFFGIEQIHGQLIREGTCGNSDRCDYLIVGSSNPIAAEYETVTDEKGFLVSRRNTMRFDEMGKYYIEKDSVQETLMIPLIGRKACSDHYPHLFFDPEADRILGMLDYDLAPKLRKMETQVGLFGALEVAQRQYDLAWEVKDYLKTHPGAAVVNMGCGLDDTFRKCDNGTCKGYNIDMPDVIETRNALLPAGDREINIACDLNDFSWMDMIDASGGAVFFASGVFYYFQTDDIKRLFAEMSRRFPGAVLAFDCCNRRGAKMMTKTWIKEAGINDVNAYFSLENAWEIKGWSGEFADVTSRSYMRGYRDIYDDVIRFHRLMIRFCDKLVRMVIIRIDFK